MHAPVINVTSFSSTIVAVQGKIIKFSWLFYWISIRFDNKNECNISMADAKDDFKGAKTFIIFSVWHSQPYLNFIII